MSIGTRLKDLRTSTGKTQIEVADYLQISPPAYSNYERGSRLPDAKMLRKLASFYHTSSDYLIGLTDEKSIGYKLAHDDLPKTLKETPIEYIEVDKYTKKYGLSKKQIQDLLEQAIILTQIAKKK